MTTAVRKLANSPWEWGPATLGPHHRYVSMHQCSQQRESVHLNSMQGSCSPQGPWLRDGQCESHPPETYSPDPEGRRRRRREKSSPAAVHRPCLPMQLTQTLTVGPVAAHNQYLLGLNTSALIISPPCSVYKCLPSFKSQSIALPSYGEGRKTYSNKSTVNQEALAVPPSLLMHRGSHLVRQSHS